jgi:hypothetical protein
MSKRMRALPADPVEVRLVARDELEGMRVRLPMHDQRYKRNGDLPSLVVVRSSQGGHEEIAGTGWWGAAETNPEEIAVEASPSLVRAMAGSGNPSSGPNGRRATIKRARWRDIAFCGHGFWIPAIIAVLTAVVAVAGTAFNLAKDNVPLKVWLPLLVLAVAAALTRAARDIVNAVHRR